jgi:hypothetical protein
MGHVGASILYVHTVEIIDYTFGFKRLAFTVEIEVQSTSELLQMPE